MKWFYYNDRWRRVGPFSDAELRQLAQTGVILPSTTVENEDGRQALAERVAGLFAAKAASTQSWETRFQKLTETVVEGGNVVDGKMNDFSKRLDGVALTTGELTRRLTALETSSREARDALIGRADVAEKRLDAKDAELSRRADSVEKRFGDKTDELTRRIDEFERRWSAGRAETTKRVGDLDARVVGVVDLSRRVGVLENKDGDLAKRLDALETSVGGARLGVSRRLDAVEKTVDGARSELTERVAELEKKGGASGDLPKRLDALETSVGGARSGLTKRVADLEKRGDANGDLAKRVAELEKKGGASGELSKRLDALEASVGGARSGLTKRVADLEKRGDANGDLAKRVAELEKKGGASGELSKRLDALEASVGGARSGLTKRVADLEKRGDANGDLAKRVAELEKKGGASGDLPKRLDALEASSDRVTAYWEVVERQREVIADFAKRFASAEKSGDAKVGVLTKRVGELENRADASGVWTKRLDSLARRLETNDAEIAKRLAALEERDDATATASESTRRLDGLERRFDANFDNLAQRLGNVEKEVGKRSPEVEPSRAFESLVEKLNGLGEALAAFDARFERLAERLDVLERRFDEETKRSGGQSDESRRGEPENCEYKTTRPALLPNVAPERESALRDVESDNVEVDLEEEALKLDFWSDDGESGEESAVAEETATTARRWAPGKYRVGDELPPGRYRAEIRRGWASIELELADDYRCYVLETDPNVDGYAPRCVLEAPEGAIATFDNPVELTYLGALR